MASSLVTKIPPSEQVAVGASVVGLTSVALLLVSIGFAVAGQITLKAAMNNIGHIGTSEIRAAGETVMRAVREPMLWAGLGLFGISSLFWLVVLSRVPLSVAYPFVGVSYIVIVFLSNSILHEQVPLTRWLGVLVVATGIAIVGLSFGRAAGT
jgi:drug/metabolite transporter (DMT)-like permease